MAAGAGAGAIAPSPVSYGSSAWRALGSKDNGIDGTTLRRDFGVWNISAALSSPSSSSVAYFSLDGAIRLFAARAAHLLMDGAIRRLMDGALRSAATTSSGFFGSSSFRTDSITPPPPSQPSVIGVSFSTLARCCDPLEPPSSRLELAPSCCTELRGSRAAAAAAVAVAVAVDAAAAPSCCTELRGSRAAAAAAVAVAVAVDSVVAAAAVAVDAAVAVAVAAAVRTASAAAVALRVIDWVAPRFSFGASSFSSSSSGAWTLDRRPARFGDGFLAVGRSSSSGLSGSTFDRRLRTAHQ